MTETTTASPPATSLRRLLQLGKESAIYGISGILVRSISLFLVPIYTRVFTPDDYGIRALVTAVVAVATVIMGLGTDSAFAIYFYDEEYEGDRSSLVLNYLLIQVASGIALFLILVGASSLIARDLLSDPSHAVFVWLAALTMVFNGVASVATNVFRLARRPWASVAFSTALSLSSIAAAVVLVVILGLGLWGSFAAQALVAGVFAVVALWLIRDKLLVGRVSTPMIRDLARIGIPYVPTGFALMSITMANRFFLEGYHDLREVGLFSVGNSLASGLLLLTGAFQMAIGPYAFSIRRQPNADQTYARILSAFLIVAAGAGAALSVFASDILRILTTPAYMGAALVVPFLAAYVVATSLGYIASLGSWFVKNTTNIARATTIAAVLNILFNFLLVPRFGMVGAGVAMALAQGTYVTLLFRWSQQAYRIPYRWREAGVIVLGAILVGWLGRSVEVESLGLSVLAKSGILVLFPVVLLATGVVPYQQTRRAAAACRGWMLSQLGGKA